MKNPLCIGLILFLYASFSSLAQLPAYSVTVNDSSLTEGYFFLANEGSLLILDKYANTVYCKPGKTDFNFALQSNGSMTYFDSVQYYFMDSTFTIADSIKCKNNIITDKRELIVMPNGNFLLLGSEIIKMDLSQYTADSRRGSDTAKVRYAVIQEQDANRNVVFEWHAKDYFKIDDVDTSFFHLSQSVDLMHSNALAIDDDGNILLCTRNYSEIAKINHKDGSVMWRWGGKRNEFKFVNCPVPFYGQHDVRRISNGHITLYDNGVERISPGARAMEFDLDEKNKIATLKWSYINDSAKVSYRQGNVQRLKKSKTLLNFGEIENFNEGFVVVDSARTKILEVDSLHSYRVLNYSSLPWQLHRPQIICFDSLGVKYLRTAKSYSSYKWSDSSIAGIIPITKPGTYSVFVPYGQGGYIRSEKFFIKDISLPCGIMTSGKKESKGKRKSK